MASEDDEAARPDPTQDEAAAQNGSASIADRAANGDDAVPEEELFPMGTLDGDPNVTLKTLIRAGHRVESTVSMGTAEVPAPKGGLFDPNREGMALITFEVAGYEPIPQREGERHEGKKIVGWKIRQKLRVIFAERVDGEAGAIEANFAALLDADEAAAGALLDRLSERTKKKLAGGRHPSRVKATA